MVGIVKIESDTVIYQLFGYVFSQVCREWQPIQGGNALLQGRGKVKPMADIVTRRKDTNRIRFYLTLFKINPENRAVQKV